MEGGRSLLAILGGFGFWIAMAYFFYQRDLASAFGLVAITGVLFGLYRLTLYYLERRAAGPPAEEPPRSDLPEYDFTDIKPKDFE